MPSVWMKEFNDIIRDVIYADTQLKQLMEIPEGTTIMQFIDSYFIRAGYQGKVLQNQKVRIVYGVLYTNDTGNPNVTLNTLSFDIYVKDEEAHNVYSDRLIYRNQEIAQRLQDLLLRSGKTKGYKFYVYNEGDMGTSTIGYSRYNISFNFKRAY